MSKVNTEALIPGEFYFVKTKNTYDTWYPAMWNQRLKQFLGFCPQYLDLNDAVIDSDTEGNPIAIKRPE